MAVTLGGNAVGKVGSAIYSSDGRSLQIPVTTNFANGDTLTVTGLKLAGVPPSPDTQRLELNFTGGLDAYDQYTLTASQPPSYNGGTNDGWGQQAMAGAVAVGGADVTMSSGADQPLAWLSGNPALAMLTITAASPGSTLTSGTTIQIAVPATWSSWFDTNVAVTLGGNAVGKVGSAIYSSDGRSLQIPVTTNFANGDTLTVTGLKLAGVPPSPDTQRLELNFTGGLDAYDQYTLTASQPPSYNGGANDGWGLNGPANYEEVGDMIAPSSAITFTAQEGAAEGEISLSWDSPGDDGGVGNLTGNYRIQYATYTVTWSTSSTPTDATTVTISTTNAVPGSAQSHTVTGLIPLTTYHFVLWTCDDGPNWSDVSNSTWAIPSAEGYAPSTSALTAVTGANSGEVNLSWSSAGADGVYNNLTGNYRIQYATYAVTWSTSSTPTDATTVTISTTNAGPGSAQIRTVTGLAGGVTHYFVLWTGDEVPNWSGISNTAGVLLAPSPPATADWTSRSQTSITAGWVFSVGASSYTLVVSTVAANPPVAVAGSSVTAALSGTVTALTPNTPYFGFITACNGAGCSAYTAVGSTATWANPPVSLSTTAMNSVGATLSWDSSNNPAGTAYVVETATEPGGAYTVSFSTSEVTALLTNLSPGTPACYRVLANSWDNVPTAPSNELCLVPTYTDPGVGSLTTVSENSIRGDWGSAAGATSYTLSLSTMVDNPPVAVEGSDTTAGLNTTIAGLTANTSYYGFVTGCNGNGCSANTVLGVAVTFAAVPQGLAYTGLSAVGVTVSFSNNGNPPGTLYEIERAGGAGNPQVSVTTNTTAPFVGLDPGTSYTVRVRAINHGSLASAYSETLSLTTTGAGPAVPMNLRGSLGTGGITYAWDPVTRDTNGDVLAGTVTYHLFQSHSPSGPFTTELASTTGTVYGLVLSPPPNQYHAIRAECLDLFSGLTPAIDNVDGGRYVYPSEVGHLAVTPQGLLTGETSAQHTATVAPHSADGGLVGFEVTVVNPSGGSAGDVTFSPVGEMTIPLPSATGGVRPVEKWTGSRWSLVGSARVGPPGVVTVNIARTGIYRVMGALESGPLVREVYNRSFSPNGDGRAEEVVFRLENSENLPMDGAVYNSDNMHVADMAPGPIPGLTLKWDGRARHGAICDGGIYHYEITVGGRRTSGIVVLLK
ncbi:MAG: fibronectin type III domain-containing protein [Elusimicrobia bacterium]|nr:fibronectin type III domain-containing protein [Elusimicrobiota bacterium]